MALIRATSGSGGGGSTEILDVQDAFKGTVAYSSGAGYKNITKSRGANYTISNSNTIVCGADSSAIVVFCDEGGGYESVTGKHRLDVTHNGVTTQYDVWCNRYTLITAPLTSGDTIKFYRLVTSGATSAQIYIFPTS